MTTSHGSNKFAILFLVLLVLLALGFFLFYVGNHGVVSEFQRKDATMQGVVSIHHRHDNRRVQLDDAITKKLRNFISWRKNEITRVEIVVNDIPSDNRVTPQTRTLVFNLDVHFTSGAIIRTRPHRVSGAGLKDAAIRAIKKAQAQHARYLKDGTVTPGQKGRVINI